MDGWMEGYQGRLRAPGWCSYPVLLFLLVLGIQVQAAAQAGLAGGAGDAGHTV